MKITGTDDGSVNVNKALSEASAFQFEDITSDVLIHKPVQPKLLTALFGSSMTNKEYLMTDTFKFDSTSETAVLPTGKSYSGYGLDIPKDVPKQYIFSVPSFGLRYNVSPADYVGRRIPGSTDLMDEAYCIALMQKKSTLAWELMDELALAQLATADTNLVRTGPFEEYNFYTTLMGGARPAAVALELDDTDTDSVAIVRAQKKELLTDIAKAGQSATRIVVLCGDTLFTQMLDIERNESLARPLKSTFDFASQEVNTSDFGSMTFMYDNFYSELCGVTFINYGAEIIAGTKLVADTAGYMMPTGSDIFKKVFAPARTRQYVNTSALEAYSWSSTDDRQGVTVMEESNRLYSSLYPQLIRNLVNT